MIDPKNITNYNLTEWQLQEHILFWVCAAGKNGVTAAKCLDKLLTALASKHGPKAPFDLIKDEIWCHTRESLFKHMKESGIGCYRNKAVTFMQLAFSSVNLANCSVEALENIYGIGPKTARCFIIHSRPNQKYAGLDRHILHWLRDQGYTVPKSTPNPTKYKQIEQWFLAEVEKSGKTVSELDLEIWNKYRK
jgi:thermostable 8-oxoguanine DNA glycosylase